MAIQETNTPTLRHVPALARHTWASVLSRALAAVAHRNDEASWVELLMLPQTVLCSPPRGGQKHHKAAAAFTMDRLKQWQNGERMGLWESKRQLSTKASKPLTAAERQDLATSLGREGFDKKACAALLSDGLCPFTPATATALKALHPSAPAPTVQPVGELPLAPDVAPELVARCLRAFPSETAPGPTGLRIQHLREACVTGCSDNVVAHLAAVVNLLIQGRAPPSVAPVLAGAGLVALPKPNGGVRPIAVGELLRRLAGKCLMSLVRSEAGSFFWPAQVGVGVSGGAEKAVHALRAWTARHSAASSKALVKLDFTNAFNCVNREVALRAVATHFPALARFATWCYQQPTRLQFGALGLDSQTGVQQGDPLGPLLFSVALQPLALELRQSNLDLAMFYLDDGVLAGDIPAVSAALAHVQQEAARLGLSLNLSKCEAVVVGATGAAALQPHLPHALLLDGHGACRVLRNFEFLGAAIGDDAFCHDHTAARASKANRLLEAIAEMDDPQVALRLLRACGGFTRMVHSMRCTPPRAHAAALATFDQMVRTCFGGFTGLHLEAPAWGQAGRSFAHAGLALRSSVEHASAAFLASLGSSLASCSELDGAFSRPDVVACAEVQDALVAFNAHLPPAQALPLEKAMALKQSALSACLDDASWAAHLGSASASAKAALLSEASPGGRAFLGAIPSGKTRMEKATFLAELRLRLGVADAPADSWCPRCDGIMDMLSHHAGSCIAGGERTQRHHAVRDVVFTWAAKAGLHPEKERPSLLLPQHPDDMRTAHRRPADVYLPALAGSPAALDFAVTAHQRPETLALASNQTGAAADAYARHKESHLNTAALCASQGVAFVPMVAETTGLWETGAARVLRHIAAAAAARSGDSADIAYSTLLQELSVVIRSFRARAALRRRSEAAAE